MGGLNRIGRDSATRTGSSATIFVLDTGVRTTHTDFGGRASSGADVSSGSLQPCYGSTSCALAALACAHTPYTTDGWVRAPERLQCEPMVHVHRIRSLVPKPGCKLPCALLHACLRAVHSEGGSQHH